MCSSEEARMQGQLAARGRGKNGRRAAEASAATTAMTVMDQKRSSPPLSSAFHEAWSRAAKRTRAVMERVMDALCHVPLRATYDAAAREEHRCPAARRPTRGHAV